MLLIHIRYKKNFVIQVGKKKKFNIQKLKIELNVFHSILDVQTMKRQTSLDVLRIIATFEVVWIHCIFFASEHYKKKLPFPTILSYIFTKTCNFLFMLISGYVGMSVPFRISHVLSLIIETEAILVFIAVFVHGFFYRFLDVSSIDWFDLLTSIAHNRYWYTAPFLFTQLVFYFIFPTIQKTPLKKYSKYSILILLLLIFQQYKYYKIGLNTDRYDITSFMMAYFMCPIIKKLNDSHNERFSLTSLYHRRVYRIYKYFPFLFFIFSVIYNYYISYYTFPSTYWFEKELFNTDLFEFPSLMLSASMLAVAVSLNINKYTQLFRGIAELSYGIYLFGLGPHMDPSWNIRRRYRRSTPEFVKFTFMLSLKTMVCLGSIVFIINRMLKLFIFRRGYYTSFIRRFVDS